MLVLLEFRSVLFGDEEESESLLPKGQPWRDPSKYSIENQLILAKQLVHGNPLYLGHASPDADAHGATRAA
jgi:hypothetical protein